MVAAPADAEPSTSPPPVPGGTGAGATPKGVDGALEQMLAAAEQASFAEVLGRTLVATAPAPAGPSATTEPDPPPVITAEADRPPHPDPVGSRGGGTAW